MKNVGTSLRLTLYLSLLAAIALGFPTSTPAGAGPKPQDVNVVNTPLPVQGTVNVGNFPTSSSVSVTNFPTSQQISGTVSVNNLPSSPVPTFNLDERGRSPYQQGGFVVVTGIGVGCVPPSTSTICLFDLGVKVPTGKRLVVQYISANVELDAAGAGVAFDVSVGGSVLMGFQGPRIGTFVNVETPTLLYVDPGQSMSIGAFSTGGDMSQIIFSVRGYLIDCSAAPCAAF